MTFGVRLLRLRGLSSRGWQLIGGTGGVHGLILYLTGMLSGVFYYNLCKLGRFAGAINGDFRLY